MPPVDHEDARHGAARPYLGIDRPRLDVASAIERIELDATFEAPEPAALPGPKPRAPIRRSSSLEGTFGCDAEPAVYHAHQHRTWARLLDLQQRLVDGRTTPAYARARQGVGAFRRCIPSLADLDAWLRQASGWRVVRANGYVRPPAFFEMLRHRRFPCMDELRHVDELMYSPEPDMFHDVVGHLPMLCDRAFAEYYSIFGRAGASARHADQLLALDRIYWFTMEFGLLGTLDAPLAYGAALLTGLRELTGATAGPAADVVLRPLSIDEMISTPTQVRMPNRVLFVTETFDVLLDDFLVWARAEELL